MLLHLKALKLGYKDSNLEMTESESVALPFGDSPLMQRHVLYLSHKTPSSIFLSFYHVSIRVMAFVRTLPIAFVFLYIARICPRSAAGSFDRIRNSPTKTASAPAFLSLFTSSKEATPDSATKILSEGIRSLNRAALEISTVKSFKFRLFTPITLAPAFRADLISSSL